MSDFFEEKKNSQKHFRESINKFLQQSPQIQSKDQFSIPMLTSLLSSSKLELVQKDRINLQKLYQVLKSQESGYQLNHTDFTTIFGSQKTMKLSDLSNILKQYNLDSFDLKNQLKQLCFEDKKFKYTKYDKLAKQLGYNILNTKSKQIAIDCYDFNNNKNFDESDIDCLLQILANKNIALKDQE